MGSWRRALSKPPPPEHCKLREQVGPGTMVTPNVRLESRLGEGAMGEVWVAEHLTLKTQVAVKFISGELDLDDPEVLVRFNREASTAAQIKSPYVVQTFDQGVTSGGTPYIVMELLEGESLGDRLDRTGWLSLRQTAQVIAQTAKALNSAHKLNIVHRDIKPDNIFLVPSDDGLLVKVLDFGIAKEAQMPKMGGLTTPGVLVGTPEFMSPEQVMTVSEVDYRADLWALAVVAYACVTGSLPFTAEAVGELCVQLVKAEFASPSQLRDPGAIPPAIDQWFKVALHPDSKMRFRSAKEMALGFIRGIPPGSEDLEEEVLHTGEFHIPPVTGRKPTAIGMGSGELLPKPQAPAVRGAATAGTKPRGSSDAITLPRFDLPARPSRLPWIAAAIGAALLIGLAGVFVAWPSGDGEPDTGAGEPPDPSAANAGQTGPEETDESARPDGEGTSDGAELAASSAPETTPLDDGRKAGDESTGTSAATATSPKTGPRNPKGSSGGPRPPKTSPTARPGIPDPGF